uniref:Uncharacterized protein n=1 Tax=Caenorhabditis japonica TaxID=281687 RepID=A0A8R1DRR7_CAEJA
MESVLSTASTVDDTDSPSSLTAEPSISDSAEQLLVNENTVTNETEEEERKNRRLNRRKALAVARNPFIAPQLGKVLNTANNTIDLTTEDDDPNNQWFKKMFAGQISEKQSNPESRKTFAVPVNISKNVPKSLIRRENMKKQLQASMSAKRRKEQDQRRKMYQEDNEHLQASSDEEEEEAIIKKKKKPKKSRNDNGEYNSEDDEDYKPECSDSSDDSEGAGDKKDMDEQKRNDDEISVNLLNDSFTFDVFNIKKRPGPGSTISNFDSHSQTSEFEKNGKEHAPLFANLTNDSADDMELLDLCSGTFGDSNVVKESVPDTLQLLLNDEKAKSEKVPIPESDDEDDDDKQYMKKKTLNKSKMLNSDDEDEISHEESAKVPESYDIFESNEDKKEEEEKEKVRPQRIVVSGDEESEEEQEKEEYVEEGRVENEEEEDEVDDEEEQEEVEDEAVPEPNFDDEDDELAVIKRIEHQEYKKNIKKKTLFDEEASLSGDDVGSDVDDEDGADNAYEAEEGDADDVPDNDTIRRQNYKLLLKQESAKEQRALAKLQDRLLADGDLGGVETNRQFRFKLREEVEIQLGEDTGNNEEKDEEEQEDDEEKKKERVEMLKYKMEHADELMLLDEPEEDDNLFKRAGRMIKVTENTFTENSEEITIKSRVGKPSLLSKTSLAVSFQEVLGGGGSVGPKQMYVQNYNPPSSSTTAPSNRLSTGAVKRGRQSPVQTDAKRVKQSKLSALE